MALQAALASPELRQLDAGIGAKERELVATKRRFFLPDITFGGELFGHRDHGKGTEIDFPGLNNWDWTVQVQATYPLFEGTARYARQARAREELQELTLRRQATSQRVEQRIRSILEATNASFVGIELARSSAQAARQNLDLVSDSYAAGVVDILRLLDAQNFAPGGGSGGGELHLRLPSRSNGGTASGRTLRLLPFSPGETGFPEPTGGVFRSGRPDRAALK